MDYFRDNRIINSIVRIKVVGVGGGGNSVLMRLAEERIPGIELLGVNTDTAQLSRLQQMGIPTLPIGTTITRGRGTGGSAKTGAEAAMLDKNVIARELRDVDLVFITAGLGSGVGTGAAPIVSQIAHNLGILTIGVVTAPFSFEGKRKMQTAEVGIRQLKASLDGLLVIHNDNLMKLEGNRRLSLADSFKAADNVLRHAIIGISELILTPGVINVDFADVTSIFRQSDS
ncbi:MAG: cell division FtsZ family protein, partial [Schwartzia sp.]|nr:cell division FtsZ family protein [Schwartzia sp. (in: firmicutes)]